MADEVKCNYYKNTYIIQGSENIKHAYIHVFSRPASNPLRHRCSWLNQMNGVGNYQWIRLLAHFTSLGRNDLNMVYASVY